MKKILTVLILSVSLTGCSGLKFAWSASYATDNLAADLARAKDGK